MKATIYGEYREISFNPLNINFIIVNGIECITCFQGGEKISLSYSGLRQTLLKKFKRVYSYEFNLPVYINPRNIAFYKDCDLGYITLNGQIAFNDGSILKGLSGADLIKMASEIDNTFGL